jgi:hypothetical protein
MVHDRVDKIHKGAKSRRKGRLVVEYLPDAQAAFAYAFDAYIAIDNRGDGARYVSAMADNVLLRDSRDKSGCCQ